MNFILLDDELEELLEQIIKKSKEYSGKTNKAIVHLRRGLNKLETMKFDAKTETLCNKKYLKRTGRESTYKDLTHEGLNYFKNKEKYQFEPINKKTSVQHFSGPTTIIEGNNNTVISISTNIEKYIETEGGEDKQELRGLLKEVNLLIEEIRKTSQVQRNPSFAERLGKHMEKHSVIYSEIIKLIGRAVFEQLK